MRKLLVVCLGIALAGCGRGDVVHQGKSEPAVEAPQHPAAGQIPSNGPVQHGRAEPVDQGNAEAAVSNAIDAAVAEDLIELLKNQDPSVRSSAAGVLGGLGEHARAVPNLVELLKDQEPFVRGSAAYALGEQPSSLAQGLWRSVYLRVMQRLARSIFCGMVHAVTCGKRFSQ